MKQRIVFLMAIMTMFNCVNAQSPVSTFPFELNGDHVFIKVTINGSNEFDFIFDTGDSRSVLDISHAADIHRESGGDVSTMSAEGSVSGKLVKHNELKIGSAQIHNVKLQESSLKHLQISIGRKIDGIIGYDILKNFVVKMDFDKMEMSLYKPSGFQYRGSGKAFAVKLNSYIPHIKASVVLQNGEKLEGEFFVDTGARTAVDFNSPFVYKHALAGKIGNSYTYLVAGLGKKEHEHHKGKIKSVSVADFSFDNVPVGLSHSGHGIQANKKVSGILGSEFLRKFNIVYDYNAKMMYWEKNSNYDAAFNRKNSSGLCPGVAWF